MKKNTKIIIFCIIAILIVFLAIGEHDSREMNELLSKIGLKRTVTAETEVKGSSGLASLFGGRITNFHPNYVGMVAYLGISWCLLFALFKK
jgi:hypothetical protein